MKNICLRVRRHIKYSCEVLYNSVTTNEFVSNYGRYEVMNLLYYQSICFVASMSKANE